MKNNLNDLLVEELWKKAEESGISRRKFLVLLGTGGGIAVLSAWGVKTTPVATNITDLYNAAKNELVVLWQMPTPVANLKPLVDAFQKNIRELRYYPFMNMPFKYRPVS